MGKYSSEPEPWHVLLGKMAAMPYYTLKGFFWLTNVLLNEGVCKKGVRKASPEICIRAQHREPNAMYERRPELIEGRIADSNLFFDLARMVGAGYVHASCLGSLVSESPGHSNYRRQQPDKDAA